MHFTHLINNKYLVLVNSLVSLVSAKAFTWWKWDMYIKVHMYGTV